MTDLGLGVRIISAKAGKYLGGVLYGWVDYALALKKYADCLLSIPTACTKREAVYLMLMGLALENLAKGIIARKSYGKETTDVTAYEEKIKNLKITLNDGKTISINTHRLDELYCAKNIGFQISSTERDHLKIISEYIEWKGRYPVPLDINKLTSNAPEPNFEELSTTAKSIYEKAITELTRALSDT